MNTFFTSAVAGFQLLFSLLSGNVAAQPSAPTEYSITYTIEMDDYEINQSKFQIPETGESEVSDYNYRVVSSENGMRAITPIDPTPPMSCSVVVHCEIRDGKIVS